MRPDLFGQLLGQYRHPVLVAFAGAHQNLAAFEVHVLDPEGQALHEANAAAVEDLADEPEGGLQVIEERDDLAPGEDGREMVGAPSTLEAGELRNLDAEDAPVEEDDRAQGLGLVVSQALS